MFFLMLIKFFFDASPAHKERLVPLGRPHLQILSAPHKALPQGTCCQGLELEDHAANATNATNESNNSNETLEPLDLVLEEAHVFFCTCTLSLNSC